MKNIKSLLPVLALTVGFGFGTAQGWANDNILTNVKFGESNYCHMHFAAMLRHGPGGECDRRLPNYDRQQV